MNVRRSLFACALVLLSLPVPSRGESLAEAQEAFAAVDRKLNKTYREVATRLPPVQFEQVKEEQRNWIEYRDRRAEHAAILEGKAENGKEKASPEYWIALTYLTETRIEILDAWTRTGEFAKTWEGVWIDGYGGLLMIDEREDGTLSFTCNAVRGASYHLGNIDGIATANETTARFSIRPEGAEKETWLTFVQENDGRLRLIGENTSYFHGARAYFDGQYLRVRELTKEDREDMASPPF